MNSNSKTNIINTPYIGEKSKILEFQELANPSLLHKVGGIHTESYK